MGAMMDPARGTTPRDSGTPTAGLVEASERGVDTHGIALLGHYVENLNGGGVNKAPAFKIHQVFPTMAVMDADHGFGLSAGYAAVHHAAAVAREQGMCAVMVRNSTHCGAMSAFTLRGARLGFVTVASTNTDPRMLSPGGVRPYFGTNPIAVAAPRSSGPPFSYDAATTAIPYNKVMVARRAGKSVADGLAADAEGRTTTDAGAAEQLHAFGGYKGYGLAAVVDVLCGVMTAMPFGRHFAPMYGPGARPEDKRNVSQFLLLMRPDAVDRLNGAEPAGAGAGDEAAARAAADAATPVEEERSAEGRAALSDAAAAWSRGEGPPVHGVSTAGGAGGAFAADDAAAFEPASEAACLGPASAAAAPVWARGTFQDRVAAMTAEVRSEPAAEAGAMGPSLAVTGGGGEPGAGVQLAGDPQERIRAERLAGGIPVPPETAAVFAALAEGTGVAPAYL